MKLHSLDTKQKVNRTLEASMDLVRSSLAENHSLWDDYRLNRPILIARVDKSEKVEDASPDMTTLKACFTGLGRDVDQLKFTDISMIWVWYPHLRC